MRGLWLCSAPASTILQRTERGVSDSFNSSRVDRPLQCTPSPFGRWQPPADGMSRRSALYSAVDCARRSRRTWHVEMTTYSWTLSSRWTSIWITLSRRVGVHLATRLPPLAVLRQSLNPNPWRWEPRTSSWLSAVAGDSRGIVPIAARRDTSLSGARCRLTRGPLEQRSGSVNFRLLG